jgi:hypothetical protein
MIINRERLLSVLTERVLDAITSAYFVIYFLTPSRAAKLVFSAGTCCVTGSAREVASDQLVPASNKSRLSGTKI